MFNDKVDRWVLEDFTTEEEKRRIAFWFCSRFLFGLFRGKDARSLGVCLKWGGVKQKEVKILKTMNELLYEQ